MLILVIYPHDLNETLQVQKPASVIDDQLYVALQLVK